MTQFIRIVVAGTETLVNLANVVSVQFWEEGEYRRPYAAIVTVGVEAPHRGSDPASPHTITVQDEEPIAMLRAELRRAGVLPLVDAPAEAAPSPDDHRTHWDEPHGAPAAARDSKVVDETMPVTGPKFDRGRPRRGYNQPK